MGSNLPLGRCEAARDDERDCDGRPDLLLVRDEHGDSVTGCMVHCAQMLADVRSVVFPQAGTAADARRCAELSQERRPWDHSA
jgi:hypothetical protein